MEFMQLYVFKRETTTSWVSVLSCPSAWIYTHPQCFRCIEDITEIPQKWSGGLCQCEIVHLMLTQIPLLPVHILSRCSFQLCSVEGWRVSQTLCRISLSSWHEHRPPSFTVQNVGDIACSQQFPLSARAQWEQTYWLLLIVSISSAGQHRNPESSERKPMLMLIILMHAYFVGLMML